MAHLGKPLEKLVEQQRARRMSSLVGEASDEALIARGAGTDREDEGAATTAAAGHIDGVQEGGGHAWEWGGARLTETQYPP